MPLSVLQWLVDKGVVEEPTLFTEDAQINPEALPEPLDTAADTD